MPSSSLLQLEDSEFFHLAPCQAVRALRARNESHSLLFPLPICQLSPSVEGPGGHCLPSNYYRPGFWCPLVAQSSNDLLSVHKCFPYKGLTGLQVASKDRPPPKRIIIVGTSQTSGTSSGVSKLGLLQQRGFEQVTISLSSTFSSIKWGLYQSGWVKLCYSNSSKIPVIYSNKGLFLLHAPCPLWLGSAEALLRVIFTLTQ